MINNHTISPREMQVAELLSWGFTNKEVARQLFISQETVFTHRKNIYEKLSLHNLADLTRWYFGETLQIEFGLAPLLRRVLAIFFLMLALSIEYFHIDAMRTRTVRSRRTEEVARARKKRKKYKTLNLVS